MGTSYLVGQADRARPCPYGCSACKKGARSHVLEAIGLPAKVIDGALRIGISRMNTEEDILALCAALKEARDTLAHS